MRIRVQVLMAGAAGLSLLSCGGSGGGETNDAEEASKVLALDEASGQAALEERYAKFEDDVKRDDEGRILKDSKRSEMEGQRYTTIGGEAGQKRYVANRYSKKEWEGAKEYSKKRYGGDSENRWNDAEWFLQKEANEQAGRAVEAGEAFADGGRSYRDEAALESGQGRVQTGNDVQTEVRRRIFPEPLIIDDQAYNEMSLEETRRRLGRE